MRCSFVGLADSFIAIIEGTVGVLKVLGRSKRALQQLKGDTSLTKKRVSQSVGRKKKLKRTVKISFDGVGLFKSGEAGWHGS